MEDTRSYKKVEREVRKWLAQKYSPVCAVLGSDQVTDFLREHANLSPAELLRPFSLITSIDGKPIQTLDKGGVF